MAKTIEDVIESCVKDFATNEHYRERRLDARNILRDIGVTRRRVEALLPMLDEPSTPEDREEVRFLLHDLLRIFETDFHERQTEIESYGKYMREFLEWCSQHDQQLPPPAAIPTELSEGSLR